ncbi:MAG: hypothetical protein IKS29_03100, partial [Oscillospiraceae bacterium]|nr:hypothetical protein [Oscillospiraceae bacterium]
MKTLKKLLPLALVLCLMLSLMAACAKSEEPTATTPDSSASESKPETKDDAAGETENEAPGETSELPDWKDDDPATIVFYYFSMNQNDEAGI